MLRVFLFLLIAANVLAAGTINVRVIGTPIEGSPVSLELKSGADILDAVALVGGMTLSSSRRVHLTRNGESRVVDLVTALGSLGSPVLLEHGDVIGVAEHIIGDPSSETINALLFECVFRRCRALPMTDQWNRKLSKVLQRKMANQSPEPTPGSVTPRARDPRLE
jgi:hypothetical protein